MGSLAAETESIDQWNYSFLGLSESGKGDSEFPQVLSLLSSVLKRTIQKNESSMDSTTRKANDTIFHGLRAPDLSIQSYTERIFKYSKCSPSCFILAHVYVDRYLEQPGVHLSCLNVHRLLMTSVVIAAKFIDDAFFNNAYYARVGGVSTQEMNKLEINLLFTLDFRLQVSMGTFSRYCSQLQKEAAGYIVERPIQICKQKEWTKIHNSKCQPAVQRC
ncbi:uncharacterized protein A4U43_C07F17880 [Asparagus officinalis]|uniref:Cyclin n=1 Tax=Asparagus officinalis TaxID=4686 RepID=A0A5P1EI00_ASPOF|nr:cyclin-P3-1-like isoform X1 [Asparagus officinalis]XP_020275426.1 cyclin-P3-1-like isoform X2 [Asparagus officinalis]XP_020275427.1 cyclin-P3-1-like isoform X1 [Asparagus officinalis]ONK63690.1 uncharacterized protein A4U43_C07F17880 [Asparagus officinalis]